MRGERKGTLQHTTAEGHATADIAVFKKQIIEFAAARAVTLEKRRRSNVEVTICNEAITYHAICFLQNLKHDSNLLGHPFVVLVRQEYIVAFGCL